MKRRVIQWGIGHIGKESLKAIIDSAQYELVGVWKHSTDGTDQDVGEYCGFSPAGVRATVSTEELLAIDADCVLYMPRVSSVDEVCALLASGKNVISISFLFYADAMPEPDRSKILQACEAGGSTLYGTGINPGFAGMLAPIALSSMSRSMKKVTVSERANWTFYDNYELAFPGMRFGHSKEEALLENSPYARFNSQLFTEQVQMLAAAWGVELDEVTVEQELLISDKSFDIVCGHIPEGTVSAQRYRWRGMYQSRAVIEMDALWTVGDDYPGHWPTPADGWTVEIEGTPSTRTTFLCLASWDPHSTASIDEHVHSTEIATAMIAVNSIDPVCEARVGIVGVHEIHPALPEKPFG